MKNLQTPNWLYRGYTGHEHLKEFDLINMNGRMYDPVLARFLSPDKLLQNPSNTQNYNGYSYVLNNPLKYTDPSGWAYGGYQFLRLTQGFNLETPSNGGEAWDPNGAMGYLVDGVACTKFEYLEAERAGGIVHPKGISSFFKVTQADGTVVNTADAGEAVNLFNEGNKSFNAELKNGVITISERRVTNLIQQNTGIQTGDISLNTAISINASLGGFMGGEIYLKDIATIKIDPNEGAQSGGGWDNSKLALDIGGGIYGALETASRPGNQWLGKNGKYYNNSWGGNQYTGGRSGAFKAASNYKLAGRATVIATAIIGGIETYNGYQMDGGQFGYNAQSAAGQTVGGIGGGIGGAALGAEIGAGIGVWFGGVGAIPGAIIGGFIGGFGGGYLGGNVGGGVVNYYHGR